MYNFMPQRDNRFRVPLITESTCHQSTTQRNASLIRSNSLLLKTDQVRPRMTLETPSPRMSLLPISSYCRNHINSKGSVQSRPALSGGMGLNPMSPAIGGREVIQKSAVNTFSNSNFRPILPKLPAEKWPEFFVYPSKPTTPTTSEKNDQKSVSQEVGSMNIEGSNTEIMSDQDATSENSNSVPYIESEVDYERDMCCPVVWNDMDLAVNCMKESPDPHSPNKTDDGGPKAESNYPYTSVEKAGNNNAPGPNDTSPKEDNNTQGKQCSSEQNPDSSYNKNVPMADVCGTEWLQLAEGNSSSNNSENSPLVQSFSPLIQSSSPLIQSSSPLIQSSSPLIQSSLQVGIKYHDPGKIDCTFPEGQCGILHDAKMEQKNEDLEKSNVKEIKAENLGCARPDLCSYSFRPIVDDISTKKDDIKKNVNVKSKESTIIEGKWHSNDPNMSRKRRMSGNSDGENDNSKKVYITDDKSMEQDEPTAYCPNEAEELGEKSDDADDDPLFSSFPLLYDSEVQSESDTFQRPLLYEREIPDSKEKLSPENHTMENGIKNLKNQNDVKVLPTRTTSSPITMPHGRNHSHSFKELLEEEFRTFSSDWSSDLNVSSERSLTPTTEYPFPEEGVNYEEKSPRSTQSDDSSDGRGSPSLGRRQRKPISPCKSPTQEEPGFRGVTLLMRTHVEAGNTQLSIKAFFSNDKFSRRFPLRHKNTKGKFGSKSSNNSNGEADSDSESEYMMDVPKERKPRSSYVGKQCASCGTKKTPLWRDAEDGTSLCNACGIRYKKYRVRCFQCWHIPRKDTKTNPCCTRCGEILKCSFIRTKTWTS